MSALVAPEICWNIAGAALGHCPAPAGRPSVRLQGPQTTSSAVPRRAGAQAGVLRSTKLPQQEKLPLASMPGRPGSLSARWLNRPLAERKVV